MSMLRTLIVFVASTCCISCAAPPRAQSTLTLTPLWTSEGDYKSPESVVYDAARNVLYVSNVAGYEENGEGYLSAVTLSGDVKTFRWLEGLNAPTGMAVTGDTLFIVDFNRLVEIDIPTAQIRAVYHSPEESPGLNDVAISSAGEVYVTASFLSAVFRLEDGALKPWAKDKSLEYANGVYASDDCLYVAAYHLRCIDYETGRISAIGNDADLVDLESIESDGAGAFFVSQIGERPILRVTPEGEVSTLLERQIFTADMEFIQETSMLVAPSGGDVVSAFRVSGR